MEPHAAMRLEIELNGRTYAATVEPAAEGPSRYVVCLDGRSMTVDCRAVAGGRYSLVGVEPAAWSHDVIVTRGESPGELIATVRHAAFRAVIDGGSAGRRADRRTGGDGERQVVAPMSGRVVRLLVSAGDEVAAGQGVAVVEAMKMENELRAPRAGRVSEILVAEGASVDAGQTLLRLDEHAQETADSVVG